MISAVHQHESSTGIHMSPPSYFPPYSIPLGCEASVLHFFKFPILRSCLTSITIFVHCSLVLWMKATGDTTQHQSCCYMQHVHRSLPPTAVTCSGLAFGTITCSLTLTYNASTENVFPCILIMSSRDHQKHS